MTFSDTFAAILLSSLLSYFSLSLIPNGSLIYPTRSFAPSFPFLPMMAIVHFYSPDFYSNSRICTYIWRLEGKHFQWKWTYNVCLSGSGLPHSVWPFLVPFMDLQSSWFHFFLQLTSTPCNAAHMHHGFVIHLSVLRIFRWLLFPSCCKQNSSKRGWLRCWVL